MESLDTQAAPADVTRALAEFFADIYLDYESRNHSVATEPAMRRMMARSLVRGHRAGVGYELTDLGRAALALAEKGE